MIGFSDLAVLVGAWERSKDDFDGELGALCEKLELKKQEYTKECAELRGKTAKIEQIFLKIWGLDDSHLEDRIPDAAVDRPPSAQGTPSAHCDDLAIEEEERMEMEHVIAAIKASTRDSPPASSKAGGDAIERDQYTAFAPFASAYWVEHTSTGFKHAIWKMDTFNHLAPISIRALQFLGNVTNEQVRHSRAQILKGKLKYCGRVTPLDPQDLKLPRMHELDPDKCGETNSGMWQKGIRQEGKPDLRTLRKWMDSYDREQCPCRTRRYSDMRSSRSIELLRNEGCTHVITLDSSITDNPLLQEIINTGLNHIPLMALDVEEAVAELDRFLDELFASVMELRTLTESTKSFLRRIIMKKGKAKMSRYKEAHRHATAEPFEHPAVKRELDFITGRFLICPTNKAPNTPAFVCKNFIRKLAFQRLSGPEFACTDMPPAAVISRIQLELSATAALPVAPAALSYLMTVLKAHKGAFRWITNTANSIISPAPEVCACLLRFLLPLVQTFFQERSAEIKEQYGVSPNLWWAIASVGECCANLPKRIYSVFTADITRCFETIPTDDSEDSLPAAIRFYVQCAMQVKGIPMGLACSPIWCDIYFFKYKFHAMMRLVDTGNAHLIPCFDSTFRYIDDLGAINNAIIGNFRRKTEDRDANDPCWIYPDRFIEIKENTVVLEEGIGYVANFLSMSITITSPIEGTYITSKFDKCAGLGFSPCRFVKFKSNRSVKQSLQVITAQVAQILMICSDPDDTAGEIAKIVEAMVENGFSAAACWRVVKKALRNAHLYQPGSLSVHVLRETLANVYGIMD
ncbi:hypothetical protein CBR_g12188 [Chara braunii]|uniref:Uncharacterized protein n=1 Tax=Chara braunii TaxID=69332 RepID=A0A388KRC8_CHABU|nr:hypothetical protein CBR_g12188 [Chara braunii]|eukprot:GBG72615.1 hypothetical protein CBR_g12188 [Chara braunii]